MYIINLETEDSGEVRKPTLSDAKRWCLERWGHCYFDGDPNLGAREIYVYQGDDGIVNTDQEILLAKISIPDED